MTNIKIDQAVFINQYIPALAKTITITPVTRTKDSMTDQEIITPNTGSNFDIEANLYRKKDVYNFDKYGLPEKADAVMLIQLSETRLNRDMEVTYNGFKYRIADITPRKLGITAIYQMCELYQIKNANLSTV